MKTFSAILTLAVLTATFTAHSQSPAPKTRSAVDVLRKISEDNTKLLERQAASLKKLEEAESTAKMVKKFAARG
jgi:hypothetical protein